MALAQSMARIQKHQVHDASWLMSAPKTAPAVAPVGPAAPKVAKAMLRLKPTGYVRPIRAMALGTSRAGPMPCIARQTLKSTTPLPWQKPQTSDQSENHAPADLEHPLVSVYIAEFACRRVQPISKAHR